MLCKVAEELSLIVVLHMCLSLLSQLAFIFVVLQKKQFMTNVIISEWQEGARGSGDGGGSEKARLAKLWGAVDSRLLKPLLTHARPPLTETLPGFMRPVARVLTTTRQYTQGVNISVYFFFQTRQLFYELLFPILSIKIVINL